MGDIRIKGRFRHTTIRLEEQGVVLERDDGLGMPPAPTKEKAQAARQALAEAIAVLDGHRANAAIYPKENLYLLMDAAEEWIRLAFAELETE